jgi:hypothetical protein
MHAINHFKAGVGLVLRALALGREVLLFGRAK